jgi:hypothetical protein
MFKGSVCVALVWLSEPGAKRSLARSALRVRPVSNAVPLGVAANAATHSIRRDRRPEPEPAAHDEHVPDRRTWSWVR